MKKIIKGFTLVELLVVIAIISILIALSLVGIQGARKSSRDSRRKADLESIRSALELYKADKHSYIDVGGGGGVDIATGGGAGNTFRNEIATYLSEVPEDPSGVGSSACGSTSDNSGYFYYTNDSGVTYEIMVGLESGESSCAASDEGCGNTTNCYLVTNP